jgi:hypothetical protein
MLSFNHHSPLILELQPRTLFKITGMISNNEIKQINKRNARQKYTLISTKPPLSLRRTLEGQPILTRGVIQEVHGTT